MGSAAVSCLAMLRPTARVLLLVAAMAAGGAQAQTPEPAQSTTPAQEASPDVQSLYTEGGTALSQGANERAAKALYGALQALQQQGRGVSADAGLILGYLADALARMSHPQTDDAYKEALFLLERAADPNMFIRTTDAFLRRHHQLGRKDEGAEVALRAIAHLANKGVDDESRINGLNVVMEYFTATDRKAEADKAFETLAPLLDATSPRAARYRGMARAALARASKKDGRLNDFVQQIEGAIEDLRRAPHENATILGAVLTTRGQSLFEEGLYLQALPILAEAAALLAGDADNAEVYVQAVSLQARLLNRIERDQEALDLIDKLLAEVERSSGADSRIASAARIDKAEMLMKAGRRAEAVIILDAEHKRLGGEADPFIAAQYLDKLAGIQIEEEAFSDAAKNAERAIEIFKQAIPEVPVLQIEPMRKRALASEGMVDAAYADRAFRELIDLSVRVYQPEHPEVARDLNAYAMFLQVEGRWDEAEGLMRRAVKGLERAYGATGLKYAYGLERVDIHRVQICALTIAGDAPDRAGMRALLRLNYANALNLLGRPEEALAILQKIRDELPIIRDKPERHALNADMMSVMSLARLGRLEDSWSAGAKLLDQMQIRTKEDAQNVVNLLLQMGDVARRADDPGNALAATKKAAEVMAVHGVETNYLWRELAQVSLPSLWRMGHP
jgi:tetratricopeptide (TPR) repeat protein